MRSPEKVLLMLEHLQGYSDAEIGEAVPIPIDPPLLRIMLACLAHQVPADAGELDGQLGRLIEFLQTLQSDAPAPVDEPEPAPAA